ncbi:Ger(x)C family spore germination protein [Paenibacillus glycinis]|uniref:Ger(X)C family spore germination protein n=1 Tax=Paenibacillus glycinis TaxID=2697035 RepID=A0ABW9XJD8_9BACL|nr:Ger(x)C family spore germination protein [Paenibacillus glycinis]NBD22729.1 Ger(x)C family spore germination protein [Paenibacillus glycinis]
MRTKRIRLSAVAVLLLLCGFAVSGCGDRAELPDKGFVMGIGIDDAGGGQVMVTFQIYKPSQTIASKGKTGQPYVNIRTKDASVMEAIRDITIHLGRKAQFSHTRVILISEKIARRVPVPQLLDLFYRDNEPRLTISLMVTRGRASDYFDTKPFIENTISQQYYLSERSENEYSGKTLGTNLLQLALQLRSESEVGAIPYLALSPKDIGGEPGVAGVTIIKDGLVADRFNGQETEGLLMLLNRYSNGVVEIPCSAAENSESSENESGEAPTAPLDESAEMLRFKAQRRMELSESGARVTYRVHAVVATLELSCTTLGNEKQENDYEDKISAAIKQRMQQSLAHLKRDEADLLGIGNDIYRRDPKRWRQWKKDWPERFARLDVDIEVDTEVLTHGTNAGNTLLKPNQD